MTAQITELYPFARAQVIDLPLYSCAIAAGFPSPADDWLEQTLDLNDLLVKNPPATFLLRVSGDSMKDAGIIDGAILVVDRSITPRSGMIVVASVDNDLTVKYYTTMLDRSVLRAANKDYKDIPITETTTVWGVVRGAVTML